MLLLTFCVALLAAGGVTVALRRMQRRPPLQAPAVQIAAALLVVLAAPSALAALEIVSWDAAAVGVGCGIGILGGQLLAGLRTDAPG
jgi:hypothetical protein